MASKKKTVKKVTKTKKVVAPKEYKVVKSQNISEMTKAYNEGYRRVGTYSQGTVAVLRNPANKVVESVQ